MTTETNSENLNSGETPEESLLLKFLTGDVTVDEKTMVNEWLQKSEANTSFLKELYLLHHASETHRRIKKRDPIRAYQKIQHRIRKKNQFAFLKRISIAASLIIGFIGISALFISYFHSATFTPTLVTVQSSNHARTFLTLPDGTEVHLNIGSKLTYPSAFSNNLREVVLEGEAYFKMTHRPDHPFRVAMSDQDLYIQVLGTEFNLQAYPKDTYVQATLLTGSIQLERKNNPSILLSPSEKAIYDKATQQIDVNFVNTDREVDWIYNRLVFKETPMNEVLSRLSRFYDIEFSVNNPIIYSYTFTGTFEDKPLYQVLDYMSLSSELKYVITYEKDTRGTKSVVKISK